MILKIVFEIKATLLIGGMIFLVPAVIHGNVGQAAPDFSLIDQDGNSHSMEDYRGKVVLLEFFGHT